MTFALLVVVSFAAVLSAHYGAAVGDNAGLVGAALVYVIQLAGLFQWTVRQTAELENQMVSVERLAEYHALPQEAAFTTERPPPAEWPQRGEIVAHNVSMCYRPGLPPSLRGISFRIPAQSLVGIVGRTGSGKSSLLAALFRLVELHTGHLEID